MERREEQFASHPVFREIDAVEGLIETTRLIADEVGMQGSDQHRVVAHVIAAVRRRLAAADPLLAPAARLDSTLSNLTKTRQELENFRSSRSHAHLGQAISHADAALAQALRVPIISSEADLQAVQEAVVSFRRSLGQHLRRADEEIRSGRAELESLGSQVSSLTADVQQLRSRADELIGRIEAQFSQAEGERRREVQAALAQIQQQTSEIEQRSQRWLSEMEQRGQSLLSEIEQRAIKTTSDVEQRFLAAQEARSEKFEKSLESLRETASAALEELESSRSELLASYDQDWEHFRAMLKARQEEVEKLVGAVAQTGMVGGYQRVANEERRAMRVWQLVTVLAILGFVALMIWLMPSPSAAFSWPAFIGRSLAALGLAALAAYASRESAKHGEKERFLRQFELEIASVGPFLSTIPKEDQDAFKKAMADRAFGRVTSPGRLDDSRATTNGVVEILRVVRDILSKKT